MLNYVFKEIITPSQKQPICWGIEVPLKIKYISVKK